jgi:hypothetical protein
MRRHPHGRSLHPQQPSTSSAFPSPPTLPPPSVDDTMYALADTKSQGAPPWPLFFTNDAIKLAALGGARGLSTGGQICARWGASRVSHSSIGIIFIGSGLMSGPGIPGTIASPGPSDS